MKGIGTEKGFTLLELLIVVAVIGILAAIAATNVSVYRIRSYNAIAVTDLTNARAALEIYFAEHGSYPR